MYRSVPSALGAALTVLCFATLAAADDTVQCDAARMRLAGQHSSCLVKAEAVALLKGETADTSQCESKFTAKCNKILDKYGSACTPPQDCASLAETASCVADALPFPAPTTTTTLPPDCDAAGDPDGDGFDVAAGDCDECSASVNPGAYDFGQNGVDDDCDGTADNAAAACDSGLPLQDVDPMNAARAIELCQQTTGMELKWGVLNAQYVRASGAPYSSTLQNGLIEVFGDNVTPRAGVRMLALSSGNARDAGDPGACGSHTCTHSTGGTPPPGFPQYVPGCPVAANINDDVALEVQLRVPTNAAGFRIKLDFYTFDYPEWVCTQYNDQSITLVTPFPPGSINGNVSFDASGTPVSANMAMQVCAGCPQGTSALSGTGFDTWSEAAATGWLTSQAPVTPGSTMTVRLAIWDAGDQATDSTVLLDAFEWIEQGPVNVQTTPAP
ncbi:MAG TPA: choice-of-anchor L domain-containing protein [Candidatus Limnocylindrales bacterium]|nr:choice-of-anchor L domain-containing protein [Candidatus Limnocylindrales bacterium]